MFTFSYNLLYFRVITTHDFEVKGYREYIFSVAVHQKYLTRLVMLIIFELARKLSFLQTQLDTFDIPQHYVCILFIFQHLIC